ncbi:hypothetical protein BDN70DRAFT_940030 [Pholiota conissans]|uniref:Uncharacterized protein n=1 Tax=Pholiota conissans TaxID=109636 RepID=A0A9P5YHR3_9AGAR|nr:hypothetical protein BDN70DRAFT_940030 [Pholiota conissans]
MPSVPPGGFKDQTSYEHFELEFNAFVKKCQTEGTPSSAAHVGTRSPFQLAIMISPLYLLVTLRLSTRSFHRRTVIDLAARLGPHRPSCIWAVESAIWDALFRLAEGRISVYTALRGLADSLQSDLDVSSNCEADRQWFAPNLSPKYNPSVSLPRINSLELDTASQSSTITEPSSRNNDQQSHLLSSPITESALAASAPQPVSPNGLAVYDQESQSARVDSSLPQGYEDLIVNHSEAVNTTDAAQSSFTQSQNSPTWSPQPTSPSESPIHSETTANYRVISRKEHHDRNPVVNASANRDPLQNDTLDVQDKGNGSDLNSGQFNERSANDSNSIEDSLSSIRYSDKHSRDNDESESSMSVDSITRTPQGTFLYM